MPRYPVGMSEKCPFFPAAYQNNYQAEYGYPPKAGWDAFDSAARYSLMSAGVIVKDDIPQCNCGCRATADLGEKNAQTHSPRLAGGRSSPRQAGGYVQ
jgi:hypothetical protein